MTKRFLALALALLMPLMPCLARASVLVGALPAGLDAALDEWLLGEGLRFSLSVELESLMPFTDDTIALINGTLRNMTVGASVEAYSDETLTQMQLKVGNRTALTLTERFEGEVYETVLSALPNRVLTSYIMPPIDSLSGAKGEDGFSLISAIDECGAAKEALIEKAMPMMTTKKANYNIKGIGKGTTSNIVKADAEQAALLAPDMRAALACGMDEETRQLIAGLSFEKQFTLALYQNADGEDIALYMKGNVTGESGDKFALRYQWAMKRGGDGGKDTYVFELKKGSRPTRSVVIEASRETALKGGGLELDLEQEVTKKTAGETESQSMKASFKCSSSGSRRTLEGSVERKAGNDTLTLAPRLTFTHEDGIYSVSGDMGAALSQGKTVQTSLKLTFSPTLPGDFFTSVQREEAYVNIDADPSTSLSQSAGEASGWQVGAPPIGLTRDGAPDTPTEILLDIFTAQELEALARQAAQNLAGELLTCLLALPAEDRALLSDGMLETDFERILDIIS